MYRNKSGIIVPVQARIRALRTQLRPRSAVLHQICRRQIFVQSRPSKNGTRIKPLPYRKVHFIIYSLISQLIMT